MSEDFICWIVCIFKYKSLHQFYLSQSAGLDESSRRSPVASPWIVSPWTPHTTTRLTPLQKKQFCQYWCPPCPTVQHVQHVHVHILTCPAEQSWLARQSAQREPSLQRFRPPRKSERKLCSIQNIQETEKYSWLRFFNVGNIISLNCNFWALKPLKTHFLSHKLCLAPRHTSPAQCTVCAWKQWSSVSQTYELW